MQPTISNVQFMIPCSHNHETGSRSLGGRKQGREKLEWQYKRRLPECRKIWPSNNKSEKKQMTTACTASDQEVHTEVRKYLDGIYALETTTRISFTYAARSKGWILVEKRNSLHFANEKLSSPKDAGIDELVSCCWRYDGKKAKTRAKDAQKLKKLSEMTVSPSCSPLQ